MPQHPDARLTPRDRELLCSRVSGGMRVSEVVQQAGVSWQTASRWVARARLASRCLTGAAGRAGWPGSRDPVPLEDRTGHRRERAPAGETEPPPDPRASCPSRTTLGAAARARVAPVGIEERGLAPERGVPGVVGVDVQ